MWSEDVHISKKHLFQLSPTKSTEVAVFFCSNENALFYFHLLLKFMRIQIYSCSLQHHTSFARSLEVHYGLYIVHNNARYLAKVLWNITYIITPLSWTVPSGSHVVCACHFVSCSFPVLPCVCKVKSSLLLVVCGQAPEKASKLCLGWCVCVCVSYVPYIYEADAPHFLFGVSTGNVTIAGEDPSFLIHSLIYYEWVTYKKGAEILSA